jgi:hypothetical protein
MIKFLIPLAAAASALTFAAPASAQWAPPVYRYQPYNYNYGFTGMRFARSMETRVARIRGDIRAMEMRRILGRGEARSLDRQAVNLQRRIARVSRYGISPREARSVETGIRNLEYRVSREASDWDRRVGHHRRY